MIWRWVILGECCSAKNSRRLVAVGRGRSSRRRVIKSEKALRWVEAARVQIARQRPTMLLEGRLRMTATLYYRSERPDLDPSLLLDAMQGLVYANDRQVREMHLYHAIDKANPRAMVLVEEL